MGRLIDKDTTIKALHKDPVGALIAGMYNVDGWLEKCEEVPAIPITYLTSRIAEFRAKDTYANQFAADFLQAIINEYNKEAHNEQTE